MQSITTLNLNLQHPNYATVMYAVQNDRLARKITATLYDGAVAWTPPYGSLAVVRFMKPDGTKGFYDTDENRQTAVTWTGNSVTIMLAEQVLTVPGNVLCQLNFYNTSEEKLTTFLWVIKVQQSVVNDETIESTDYFNVLTHQIAEALAITAYPPYINNTTHNWMTYNVENERYEDSGISAQGERGATGPQGVSIQSVTKKSGTGTAGTTDEYNVNLNNGTVAGTFTVYNGSDGQGAPSATMPLMDGTASVGIEDGYARGDHRHPTDTSRVPTSRRVNGKQLTDDITLTSEDITDDSDAGGTTVKESLSSLKGSLNSKIVRVTGTISSSTLYVTNANVTTDMVPIACEFGTPSNVLSNYTINTNTAGRITFTGITLGGSTTVDVILGIPKS